MKNIKPIVLALILLASLTALVAIGPIPQNLDYHNFADKRLLLNIPNFWDVLSNLAFLAVGCFAVWTGVQNWSKRPDLTAKLIPVVLSLGMVIVCFGSAYYHWSPNNQTLVWGRIPMTLIFMPLFSLIVYDFLGKKIGTAVFWLSVPLGIASVLYWQFTETIGQGDLRPYFFVQFFPMVVVPLILWLYPKKTPYVRYIVLLLLCYVLAKVCEHFDDAIFEYLQFWSGHTLKHFLSAVSLFYALKLVIAWDREITSS